jgi:hypothetical protein
VGVIHFRPLEIVQQAQMHVVPVQEPAQHQIGVDTPLASLHDPVQFCAESLGETGAQFLDPSTLVSQGRLPTDCMAYKLASHNPSPAIRFQQDPLIPAGCYRYTSPDRIAIQPQDPLQRGLFEYEITFQQQAFVLQKSPGQPQRIGGVGFVETRILHVGYLHRPEAGAHLPSDICCPIADDENCLFTPLSCQVAEGTFQDRNAPNLYQGFWAVVCRISKTASPPGGEHNGLPSIRQA